MKTRLVYFAPCAPLLALFLGLAIAGAARALAVDRLVDIELKNADARQIFPAFAALRGAPIVLDPCVHGRFDLKMNNTPLSLALAALASKLHLTYEERGSELYVSCAKGGEVPPTEHKLSIAETNASLPAVLEKLAKESLLVVDYQAAKEPRVTLTAESVSLGLILAVLADESDLFVAVKNGRIVVSER